MDDQPTTSGGYLPPSGLLANVQRVPRPVGRAPLYHRVIMEDVAENLAPTASGRPNGAQRG